MSHPVETRVSRRSLLALDGLNFFLADAQTGVGPFVAIHLASARHWDDQRVGMALSVAAIAGVLAQLPAGALVDWTRCKRALIGVGVAALVVSALLFAFSAGFKAVVVAQVLLGGCGSLFVPSLNAITLGLVGPRLLDRRVGRNQAFNSAGNVFAAVVMGFIGFFLSTQVIFLTVILFSIPTLFSLAMIRPEEIDYERSRAGKEGADPGNARLTALLADRRLVIFVTCVFLFHFANAAMLPQLGEMLARGHARQSSLFMGACVVVTQITISLIAVWVSRRSHSWGRKPLLLAGFGVLPIRGLLYTLTAYAPALVAIQILDGIANAIYLVVGVLVVADLTRGTGRFNLMQGALGVAQGLGAAASTTFAGTVVHHYGYRAGFLALAGIALAACGLLWLAMPETKEVRGADRSNGLPVAA
jgi:MFS family permease